MIPGVAPDVHADSSSNLILLQTQGKVTFSGKILARSIQAETIPVVGFAIV